MKKLIKASIAVAIIRRIMLSYIDPNTGGMLFQLLAVLFGLLSGILFFFSGRIKMFFARIRRSTRADESEEDEEFGAWEEEDNELF